MLLNNANKPNILYVFGGEKAQGAEIVIERLMEKSSNKAHIYLIMSPGNFADGLIKAKKPYQISLFNDLKKLNRSHSGKLQFYARALGNYLTVSFKVYRYIRNNKISIVHANTIVPASYLIPLIACAKILFPNVKWLWSDHDMNYGSRIDGSLSKLCVKLYTRTLVVSGAVKRKYGTNEKVKVLYNGLDTDWFKPDKGKRAAFRKNLMVADTDILIGIAANINPDKGQLELIGVFNCLCLVHSNIKLVLAGNYAGQFPDYQQQVETAILGNPSIIYLGFYSSMISFYNGCDIIINNSNNSRSESLGTSIYEAMACATIVLAADTGGTPEIVTEEVDGFLFKTEDMFDFEQKLNYIINNFDRLQNIQLRAREKVIAKFNIETMVKRYGQILGSLN